MPPTRSLKRAQVQLYRVTVLMVSTPPAPTERVGCDGTKSGIGKTPLLTVVTHGGLVTRIVHAGGEEGIRSCVPSCTQSDLPPFDFWDGWSILGCSLGGAAPV